MELGLKGRVALVAAASQGLGKAVANGPADDIVPFAAASHNARLVRLEAAGHFDLIDPRVEVWPTVQKSILTWS